MGGKGGRILRNKYKGHMDKTKGGCWNQGSEVGMTGVRGRSGGKFRQLYMKNNKLKKWKKIN